MMNLESYLNDGANWQAKCVLYYLQYKYDSILDATYNKDYGINMGKIKVGRFENCREQGYVFSILYKFHQKNYCVYEHRNSDSICVLINEVDTINTPTIEEMWEGKKDKWDYDKSFKYGQVIECAEWIEKDMKEFLENIKKLEENEVTE